MRNLQLRLTFFWEVCFEHFEVRFIFLYSLQWLYRTWNSRKEEKETSLLTYYRGSALNGAQHSCGAELLKPSDNWGIFSLASGLKGGKNTKLFDGRW
jgi:hypothetical protein